MKTQFTKQQTIIDHLNENCRHYEDKVPFEQIRFSLAGLAEHYATHLFDTTMGAIDPELSALLYRLKDSRGVIGDAEAKALIDYGIAALDLRAPEDREGGAE